MRFLPVALAFAVFQTVLVYAQATSGSISGRVLDPSGAVVAGAAVRVRQMSTGLTQATETGGAGEYSLPGLPPGLYSLTAGKAGFADAGRSGLRLAIDQKLRLDLELSLSPVAHMESVTDRAQALQTASAETGEVIESRQIRDLPLLGRNFLQLTRLTAGVVNGSGGNTLNVAVNGQREFANSILVDGVEASANRNNDTSLRPSLDAVEEFKVLTSAYSAEFGRASGAVIAVQMRAGTNEPHGGLYEFFRPGATAARDFFSNDAPALRQHNFGATLGAPLRKDRTFVFGSYEGVRLRNAYSYLDSVPPTAQIGYRTGGGMDLSGLKDPSTGKQVPIFDPQTYAASYYAAPFPGNLIPGNRVSAAGKAVLQNFFPAPSLPGTLNGWFNNFVSRQSYSYDCDTAGFRVDHAFSGRDRLAAAYHYSRFESLTGDRFAGRIPVAGGGDADYGDHENSRSQSLSVTETRLLSPRWLNEARFGYTRYRLDQLSLLDGQNLATKYGLGRVNLSQYPQTSGFPDIYLGFGAQTGGSTYKPLNFLDRNYQVGDTVSVRISRHELKAGSQFRRIHSAPFFSLFPTGFQYYGGPGVSLTGDPNYSFFDASAFYYNGGSDIADLLLGLPYSVEMGLQTTSPHTRSWEGSLFVHDAWRIARRLVLTLGLRYEYAAPWTEAGGQMANVDATGLRLLLAGRDGNSAALVAGDRNNFAPRVGLAYQVGASSVLRAGWGLFYSPENDAREDLLTKNYPYAVRQTVYNDIYGGLPFAYTLDAGVERAIPSVASGVPSIGAAAVKQATGSAQDLFLVDAGLRTGYSHLFNVTWQQELPAGITAESGYVGSLSRQLPYAIGDLNRANRLTAALGEIQAQYADGEASFHSFQAKVRRRFGRGLGWLAAYTFGKNLDNGPAPFNLGHNQNSHNQPQDPFQLSLERAVADNDVAHNLSVSFLYELPFGKGRYLLAGTGKWGQALLGGWQWNGIAAGRTGLPVNVVRNPQDSAYPGLRPDVASDPNLPGSERTLARYFDTRAFSTAAFTGTKKRNPGTAGRNLVRGPGLANLDCSVFKEVAVRERARLQLRFEFFNVTNTPHFANPGGDMSAGKFGSITQTIENPRIVQFAAKLRW